jgi:hypothetical protein
LEPTDKLFNLSTRADAGMGALLAGFIIEGDPGSNKCVVLRGRGQSMNLPDTLDKLQDPTLRLKQGLTTLDYSDDWESHPSAPIIRGLGMAPTDPSESALYQCLSPGRYLAVFQGKSGTAPGIGIVEVFDVDSGTPYLFNISTRARVGPGAQVMSGGFIINGNSPRRVLIRGRGPSVRVEDPLRDPLLILRQGPTVLQENDNWREASNWRDVEATGAAPEADADSAILITLEPGAYTAQVRAADNVYGGIAIVEVIDLTQ